MTVKIIATRCGIPGTRGHWPGCWARPVTTNVKPHEFLAIPGAPLFFKTPTARQLSWWGRRIVAVGCEGRSIAVQVA